MPMAACPFSNKIFSGTGYAAICAHARSRPCSRLQVYITFLIPPTGEAAAQLQRTPRNLGYERHEGVASGTHQPKYMNLGLASRFIKVGDGLPASLPRVISSRSSPSASQIATMIGI